MCSPPTIHWRVSPYRYTISYICARKCFHEQTRLTTNRALGAMRRLILTFYAPGSLYDIQVTSIIESNHYVCSQEAGASSPLVEKRKNDIVGSVACRSSMELNISEPLLQCCNTTTGLQLIKPGNETLCLWCAENPEANSWVFTTNSAFIFVNLMSPSRRHSLHYTLLISVRSSRAHLMSVPYLARSSSRPARTFETYCS